MGFRAKAKLVLDLVYILRLINLFRHSDTHACSLVVNSSSTVDKVDFCYLCII